MPCAIRIGTSGWQYRHWKGPVYPPRLPSTRMLPTYAQWFDTVEINSTFYGLPSESTVAGWREAAPAGFEFAWKGSRYLTHLKKLTDPAEGLARMYSRLDGLGEKLGPVLFQLPPRFPCQLDRLAAFIAALRPDLRYAFEFRDASWHVPSILELLQAHNCAWCGWELAGARSPVEITADFVYVRLHGPTNEAYRGSYSDEALREWAIRIADLRRSVNNVYIYFDNDEAGFAVADANRLRKLVDPTAPPVPFTVQVEQVS